MSEQYVIPEFLQPDELRRLSGLTQTAAIRRWLERAGVRFVTAPDGRPLVYRTGLVPGAVAAPGAQPAQINVGALGARRRRR